MNKFLKYLSVLALSAGTGTIAFGKAVDVNTAKTIGCNYLANVNVQGVTKPSDLASAYVATAMVNGTMVVDYYVFNVVGGTGFVMVSGDDAIKPILAWSNEASFDYGHISPEAKYWIEGYQEQINAVIAENYPAQAGTPEQWSALQTARKNVAARTTAVSPMLTTKWDQGTFYNSSCPPMTYTGCVATSMAQILKYHNWPTVGCGSHTYTPAGFLSRNSNFGNTTYPWTAMPNTVAATNMPVANLMKDCGTAVDMKYGTSESGAYTLIDQSPVLLCSEYALKTFFRYKRTLHGVMRDGNSTYAPISTAAWVSMLKAEMNAGRPVLYSGQGTSGGHAWVCDGYDASNNFHMNWGWSGSGPDGYYSVDNLAPPVLGAGGGGGAFNAQQGVIIGIEPDSFPNTTGTLKMLAHVNIAANSPFPYHNPFTVVTKIGNGGTTTFKGDFCAQVFDTLNNSIGIVQTMTGLTVNAGDSTASLTFNTTGMYAMIPSIYYVRIMYRPTGTTTWTPCANNGAYINYNSVVVNNDRTDLALSSALSIAPGSYIVPNSAISVSANVLNYSGTVPSVPAVTFNGTISAVLINCADGTTTTIQSFPGISLLSGYYYSGTFTNAHAPTTVGTYVLAIEHQPGSAGSFLFTGSNTYQNPVIVKIGTAADIHTSTAASDNVYVFPNPAKDVINIVMDGITAEEIRIIDVQGRELRKLTPGSDKMVIVPVSDFAAGVYFVELKIGAELVTKKIIVAK